MGNPFATNGIKTLEHDVQDISGFIAIDGAKNVIGKIPVLAAPGAGPYSRCKGLDKAIGMAGAVVTQPYISTGLYRFTLDEPWIGLIGAEVTLLDQGAVAIPTWTIKANVRATQTAADAGRVPGTDPTIAIQTIELRFRLASSGALTDIAVSTGFWLRLLLLRSAVP